MSTNIGFNAATKCTVCGIICSSHTLQYTIKVPFKSELSPVYKIHTYISYLKTQRSCSYLLMKEALRCIANEKAVGPGVLRVESPKLDNPVILRHFHSILVVVYDVGGSRGTTAVEGHDDQSVPQEESSLLLQELQKDRPCLTCRQSAS